MYTDIFQCKQCNNSKVEVEMIISMNKLIHYQMCINGSRQVNVFVFVCQNVFPETKKGRTLALTGFMTSVRLHSDNL